jgi:D-arabinose 1-dehydrogenase-like Zn-dependent alcohol dehydrogenase
MKAAVVHSFDSPLRLEEVPIPEPDYGQVVVKVEISGLCHTDLHAAHGDWPVKPATPFIPGHEGVGIVARVGAGCPESRRATESPCRGSGRLAERALRGGKHCVPTRNSRVTP